MTVDRNSGEDNPLMRKLHYTGLRLKKLGRKFVYDVTPPIIIKLFTVRNIRAQKRDAIVQEKSGNAFNIKDIHPAEFAFMSGKPKIELPITHLRYAGGLKFTRDQNHFVRYLDQGISALETFYTVHQPRNILELHFVPVTVEPDRDLPIRGLPWVMYGNGNYTRGVKIEKGLPANHGHQHHGPVSDQKIALEASHLDRLVNSFKSKGLLDKGDYPSGHFIVDDETGDWAFYVKDGQHRVAVMAHLGYETVTVTAGGAPMSAVTSATARHWPMVRRGLLSEDEALAILRAYTAPDRQLDIFAKS